MIAAIVAVVFAVVGPMIQLKRCAGATVVLDVVVVVTWPDDGDLVVEVVRAVVVATGAVTGVEELSDGRLDGAELLVGGDEVIDVPVTGGALDPELHAVVTPPNSSTGSSSPTPARLMRERWWWVSVLLGILFSVPRSAG